MPSSMRIVAVRTETAAYHFTPIGDKLLAILATGGATMSTLLVCAPAYPSAFLTAGSVPRSPGLATNIRGKGPVFVALATNAFAPGGSRGKL
jgi:hypothetical protein